MNEGYIKLSRKLLTWQWHDSPDTLTLMIHILLMASHKDVKYRGINVKRGQLVTTLKELAEITGLTNQKCRTSLCRLAESGFFNKQTTNKNTVITICNYDTYQMSEDPPQQALQQTNNKQITNKQQTTNKRELYKYNYNKNVKNVKKIYTHTTHTAGACAHEGGCEDEEETFAHMAETVLQAIDKKMTNLKHMKPPTLQQIRNMLEDCDGNWNELTGILGAMNNKPKSMRGKTSVYHTWKAWKNANQINY